VAGSGPGKPLSHIPTVWPYENPDGLAAWDYCCGQFIKQLFSEPRTTGDHTKDMLEPREKTKK